MAKTFTGLTQKLYVDGVEYSVLVPNLKGAQRALETGAHALLLPLSGEFDYRRSLVDLAALEYGIRAGDIEDPELARLWRRLERSYGTLAPLLDEAAERLDVAA